MKIISFKKEFKFLSNFSFANILHKGIEYPTVEHFYCSMKTLDKEDRRKISCLKTPGQAKRLARKMPIRHDWDKVKLKVMAYGIKEKFKASTNVAKLLLATSPAELVEGNYWHDQFWGDCFCEKCKNVLEENNLGKILMFRRNQLLL